MMKLIDCLQHCVFLVKKLIMFEQVCVINHAVIPQLLRKRCVVVCQSMVMCASEVFVLEKSLVCALTVNHFIISNQV